MKGFIAILLVSIVFCIGITPALARSGCCSRHDGVRADGCGCNDGTPLSSTCAPYYSCYRAPVQQYNTPTPIPPTPTPFPTNTPTPTITPTLTVTPTPTVRDTSATIPVASPIVESSNTNSTSNNNPIGGLIILGGIGGLAYYAWKRISKKI